MRLGKASAWLTLPRMKKLIGLLFPFTLALAGCDKSGTCEFKYDEGSKDGSIPAGLEVCEDGWVVDKCTKEAMSTVSLGYKTSGYTFTKGAKCAAAGYKDCSGLNGPTYYKTCPPK